MDETSTAPSNDGQDLLEHLGDNDAIVVSMTLGIEHFRSGRVRVDVRGDGLVTVTQRKSGTDKSWSATWSRGRIGEIGRELAGTGFCRLRPAEGGREPDDVPVEIAITDGARSVCSASLWHGDRYEDKALDALIRRYDAIVSEVTAGVLKP